MNNEIQELIEKHSSELSRLCTSLCTCKQDAEDLFQTTWEKVIKGYSKYDRSRPFDKWLWSVCVNAHRDMLRNPFRRYRMNFNTNEEMTETLNSIPDAKGNTEDYVALHIALRKLNPKLREVIALYYFRDFTYAEMSVILGIPEGTVKSRLNSAKNQLRKELFDE